jgi:high-affinity Fe2+/Pb2+ permease
VGIGASLFLIAVGAILAWAVDFTVSGIEIQTIGVILLVVGIVGLVLSMLFWSSFAPFRRTEDRTVIRDREVI